MANRYNLFCTPLKCPFALEFGLGRCKLNVLWTNPPMEVDWKQFGTEFTVISSSNNKITHSAPSSTATLSKLSCLGHIHVLYILYLPSKIWTTMAYHAGLLTSYCQKETAYQVVSCSLSKFAFHVFFYQWLSIFIFELTLLCVSIHQSRMLA